MSNVLYKFVAGFFMGIAEITPGISGPQSLVYLMYIKIF
ncbi:MAG: hypothetical protein CM15mP127_15630 [Gammaproteobacteria bacterium]|nr:MAG: hypothetical protein CM15mP127_15630 [Gammaproteobacteria bacterium]